MTDGLFEEPERTALAPGDTVRLRTIWGDEECTVVRLLAAETFPMVTVDTASGDTVTVNRSSLQEMP